LRYTIEVYHYSELTTTAKEVARAEVETLISDETVALDPDYNTLADVLLSYRFSVAGNIVDMDVIYPLVVA
jgi:hypothetical protein